MKNLKVRIEVPAWAAVLYILGSIIVLPWTIYLDQSLPTRHLFRHWDIAWVGLDIGLLISLLATGILAYRKSLWVAFASVMTGTFLIIDAWFDVMGAHPGRELAQAVLAAILLELPLAALSFRLAYHTLHRAYER
jgi:hypothetical protein